MEWSGQRWSGLGYRERPGQQGNGFDQRRVVWATHEWTRLEGRGREYRSEVQARPVPGRLDLSLGEVEIRERGRASGVGGGRG